jgi:hypothetical protein
MSRSRGPADPRFAGRYGHFDVLAKWSSPDWDDPTREVVRRRLEEVPPIRFFTSEEVRILEAVAERILPQHDREQKGRVRITPWIDEKLFEDRRDGYRYEDLPPQREAWRRGLAGIEETARALKGSSFVALGPADQDLVLRTIEGGNPPGGNWIRVPPKRFFRHVLCGAIIGTYYAHPLAWNEIGYSGPSSPRGHVRIWEGGVDPWEAQEE